MSIMYTNNILRRIDPVIPQSLLEKNEFFSLYPPDGGGGFVMRKELGSGIDAEITDAIIKNNCLADFGTFPEFDYKKFEYWESIERSCWINRMYFVVPMARTAMLRGDDTLARAVYDAMLYFYRNNSAPADAEAARALYAEVVSRRDEEYNKGIAENPAPIPYQWFDFQPASRFIHVFYALWFLRSFQLLSEQEENELADFLLANARVMADQEDGLKPAPGNHQALRGLALMYAAVLFGDSRFRRHAVEISNYHVVNDFDKDGLLVEFCPAYHYFELWIARDCCLLSKKYNLGMNSKAFDVFDRAVVAAHAVCRPDGRVFVLNDGCNLDALATLKTLPPVKKGKTGGNVHFGNAGIGILRKKNFVVVLDSSKNPGRFSHYHSGKNGISLWYKNKPFLVDSGCCNYDEPDFAAWFKQPQAHNTMLIDGQGDGQLRGNYEWIVYPDCIFLMDSKKNTMNGLLTSAMPAWENIGWNRFVTIEEENSKDVVTILDFVQKIDAGKKATEHRFEFVFNLHPDVEFDIDVNKVMLTNGDVSLKIGFDGKSELFVAPGRYCDGNEIYDTKQLRVAFVGTKLFTTTVALGL